MNQEPSDTVDRLRNHWWWRPGWRQGRHFHACHLTFDNQPDLHNLIERYQNALRPFTGLDLIPRRWLHLTTQGIGYTDEITESEIDDIATVIRVRLNQLPTPVVSFQRPVVRQEAIYLPAEPPEPLAAVRTQIRAAIAEALGAERLPEQREQRAGFRPHVSLAYSNCDQPAEPISHALSLVPANPVTVTITHASLLVLHRDQQMYEWTGEEQIGIGQP